MNFDNIPISRTQALFLTIVLIVGVVSGSIYAYTTNPSVEASVDSVIFGYDGPQSYPESSPQQISQHEDFPEYEYQLSYENEAGETVTKTAKFSSSQGVFRYSGKTDDIYSELSDETKYTYVRYSTTHYESLVPNRGFNITQNGTKVVWAYSDVESDPDLDGYPYGLPIARADGESVWISDSKFRQTGERTYQGYTVDVYTKVGGEQSTADSSSKVYIESETGVIVYIDGEIDMNLGNKTGLRSITYQLESSTDKIKKPKWTSRANFHSPSDLNYLLLDSTSRTVENDSSDDYDHTPIINISMEEGPIRLNETVEVSLRDSNTTVVSDTIKLHTLLTGVGFKNKEIVPAESITRSTENVLRYSELDNPSVVIDTGGEKFTFTNIYEEERSAAGDRSIIESSQTLAETTITQDSEIITYTIERYYSSEDLRIDYGRQTQRENSKELNKTYSPSKNVTLQFNNTGSATHFALHSPRTNRITLQPVENKSQPTGTIYVQSADINATLDKDTTIELQRAGITIARINGLEEKIYYGTNLYLTNVPIGEYQVRIETGDKTIYKTAVVRENTDTAAK